MYLKILTVSEVTSYIKKLFSSDVILGRINVSGEISNFQIAANVAFFTLKDPYSSINCIMFDDAMQHLEFTPQDGMQVTITAKALFYEKDGKVYLNTFNIKLNGSGELYIAFQKLKEKLYRKGMFDEKNKKPLPFLPKKICVVTSLSGSVLYDIINIAKRRNPFVDLMIFPVRVQGEMAAKEIAEAIKIINQRDDVDVIILARGGGSIEELWAFNEEIVAQAIFDSRIPIVSAVGHETDYTISDFVSDKRAPTPSAAAEIVIPSIFDLHANLHNLKIRLVSAMKLILEVKTNRLNAIKSSKVFAYPYDLLANKKLQIAYITKHLCDLIEKIISKKDAEYKELRAKLDALNPLAILSRGYAIVQSRDHQKILSSQKLQVNDEINIRFYDGSALCIVKEVLSND
ncbi:Exodeoxyribonuclease VII large subunit [Caldanaerobius fijiensis DSM 17918]|uniref:Exodeoxyribonuclease 7 large subunit n=1 Tax=Caldanaerobius fijiensis DSM 17918 TaxID=1121256 RepID=A0A1M4U7U1_9THEO|nr:exodeoxyribonuclease VII large subunit [Caldanaerobius fijiensis]SHE52724.1 Exodeoxyribonuclease VII large subunit [Caldanaerobius fijiensis DSM 17918]